MSVFASTEEVTRVMETLWARIKEHPEMSKQLVDTKLIVQFNYREPEAKITIDCSDGKELKVYTGETKLKPTVEMSMKADVAHEFWMGKLNIGMAIIGGKVMSKGPTPKVLALLPVIKPAYAIYPQVLATIGKQTVAST